MLNSTPKRITIILLSALMSGLFVVSLVGAQTSLPISQWDVACGPDPAKDCQVTQNGVPIGPMSNLETVKVVAEWASQAAINCSPMEEVEIEQPEVGRWTKMWIIWRSPEPSPIIQRSK